jgi:hypothetical protein
MPHRYPRTAEEGAYKVVCFRCGAGYKNYDLEVEPITEFRVCPECRDEINPQDFVRAKTDIDHIPFWRGEPDRVTFGSTPCSTHTAIPGFAIPGCAWPGIEIKPGVDPALDLFSASQTAEVITLG